VDHALITDPRYRIAGSIGPNHQQGDSMRHWVHWLSTNQRRVLYDPIAHTRRQAEWDDHGENYDNHTDGPDLWIAVEVPAGIHRLSLYFVNKDGHEGPNPYRDYLIELKPFGPSPAEAARLPTMARARVRFFWSGVYKQFIVGGPAKYCVRIARNGNHNTILSGVFFDKLRGPWSPVDVRPMPWLGGVRPGPAELLSDGSTSGSRTGARQKADPSTPALAQARVLWGLARAAVCWSDGFIYERPLCLLAYRSAAVTGIPRSLQRDWRWQLRILFDEDRDAFDKEMALSYDRWAAQHPDLASKHY
jgi:hypothetical protein